MLEIWKNIEGYEGCYQVSNLGRVKSLGRKRRATTRRGHEFYIDTPERILTNIEVRGYERVTLCKKGKNKYHKIHRLVIGAFTPNIDGKSYVNHIDENKLNNNVTNLEWVTSSENRIAYAKDKPKKTYRRITDDDIIKIKYLFSKGVSKLSISKELNISERVVGRVLK